jgi:hypothetical protein
VLQYGVYPAGAVHACPHVPQFITSYVTSTHLPLQLLVPAAQHSPDTHAAPGSHATSQLPQCAELVFKSTHADPHLELPEGQPSRQLPW